MDRETEPELESYFSELHIIDIPAKRESAASVPAFLLTLGLVASFLRLFFTFVVLPEGSDLSAAFYPAVCEVLLIILFTILISYLFAIFNRSFFGKAKTLLYEIRKSLNRKLVQNKQGNQFAEISTSINNMTGSLSSYAQYTADMQRNGMNQLVDSFLESLYGETHDQIQSLGESLRKFSANQAQSTEQTKALVNELIRGVENQKNINNDSSSIVSTITQYQQKMTDSSHHLSAGLQGLQQLSNSLGNIVSINAETLETMKMEQEKMKEKYENYIQCLYKQMKGYQDDVSVEWGKTMTRFFEMADSGYTQFEGSFTQSINALLHSNQNLKQSLEEQSQSMNYVSNEMTLRLRELNGSLKDTMKEFTKAIEEGTGKTISEFDQGLSEITQRLSQTIIEIRDSIDDLPVVIDSLKKHLE